MGRSEFDYLPPRPAWNAGRKVGAKTTAEAQADIGSKIWGSWSVDGAIRKLFAGQSIKLLQRADATAWYRSGTPSFWKTFLRFHLTVSSVMPIASAIC